MCILRSVFTKWKADHLGLMGLDPSSMGCKSCQPIGLPAKGHTGTVFSVAFSPNGKQVTSGSADKTLRRWNVENAQQIRPLQLFEGHTDRVTSVALSPNSKIVVSASLDDTVRIWEAHTGLPIESSLAQGTEGVVSVAFSPDGTQFETASRDSSISIWDAASRTVPQGSHRRSHAHCVFV